MEKYKYLHNLIQMPLVLIIFLAGVAGVLSGTGITFLKGSRRGIWYCGPGTVMTVFALFLTAGFNGTAFYPSAYDLNSSLTITEASSSLFTLKTMMYVSFIVPFVFAYIWHAWRSINDKKITAEEMKSEGHIY
jgi:cytochrome d ubiquinol oxidase subunit II